MLIFRNLFYQHFLKSLTRIFGGDFFIYIIKSPFINYCSFDCFCKKHLWFNAKAFLCRLH